LDQQQLHWKKIYKIVFLAYVHHLNRNKITTFWKLDPASIFRFLKARDKKGTKENDINPICWAPRPGQLASSGAFFKIEGKSSFQNAVILFII
jgi:hypothetical protein